MADALHGVDLAAAEAGYLQVRQLLQPRAAHQVAVQLQRDQVRQRVQRGDVAQVILRQVDITQVDEGV